MCGIAGIISLYEEKNYLSTLQKMTEIVSHRGNDASICREWGRVYFGHRRLSVIDLSPAANQPFSAFGYHITYNGEIYNYIEIKNELLEKGYAFQTESDTEVILAAFREWDIGAFNRLNGMWSLAIFDTQKQQIVASRDRLGEKPFYYYPQSNTFYFGSEIKQFSVTDQWQPHANMPRVIDYLENAWLDHTSETLFEGVYQLRGGEYLILNTENLEYEIKNYYIIGKTQDYALANEFKNQSFERQKEHFATLFADAVRIRLRSDVQVGASLSGGLDSSSIVANVETKARFQTISAVYPDTAVDERAYITALIRRHQFQSVAITPSMQDFITWVETLIWNNDEPIVSDSTFAQFMVFQKAKELQIKVMLEGQGADEILGGYERFYAFLWKEDKKNAFFEIFNFFRLHSWGYIQERLQRIGKGLKGNIVAAQWLQNRQNTIPPVPHFRGLSVHYLSQTAFPAMLHWADRTSMSHTVETRLPFTDFRLIEYCLALPNTAKIRNGKRKYILREAMSSLLPSIIVHRYDKNGFINAHDSWFLENAEFFHASVKETMARYPFLFNAEWLTHENEKSLHLRKPFTNPALWRVLFLGIWAKKFKVIFPSHI